MLKRKPSCELLEMLVFEGYSLANIQALCRVSAPTVRKWMDECKPKKNGSRS